MDVVWLVLDSLGFNHSSLGPDGPPTTPQLARLTEEAGLCFTQAYAPGPSSPSSHASFFTGELPSEVGMTEAYPFFDGRVDTIADVLGDTHDTYLTTVNPFLFNGLDESFDRADHLAENDYLVFGSGDDPRAFAARRDTDSALELGIEFLRQTDTPVRSFVNGLSYKLWNSPDEFIPEQVTGTSGGYRYANVINERIRSFCDTATDAFVVANYMDAHPPFDVPDEAIEALDLEYDKSELPTGISASQTDAYDPDALRALYWANVWELDRQVSDLVTDLLERNAFVVVTADHGPYFGGESYMREDRLRVPLVLFTPERAPDRCDHTVSLRSLPQTTAAVLGIDGGFEGRDLRGTTTHNTALTEYIHRENEKAGPVDTHGGDAAIRYDVRSQRGSAVVTVENGVETVVSGTDEEVSPLRDRIADLRDAGTVTNDGDIEYNDAVEGRLEDLGYI